MSAKKTQNSLGASGSPTKVPTKASDASVAPLLDVRDLKVHFPIEKGILLRRRVGWLKAVDGVSFSVARGEALGLVGESGCGKSTLGKAIMKLVPVAGGEIVVEGVDIAPLNREQLTNMRRKVQMIFQDPYSSLNPRLRIGDALREPLVSFGLCPDRRSLDGRVAELLAAVGLSADAAERYPHQFSGGQRQRAAIARALASEPSLLICDEPVSALDVSIKGQVVNLLLDINQRLGVTVLFISHEIGRAHV